MSCTNILDLPEECLSIILSLSSPTPKEVIRSSLVSKQFLSASESNSVWNKFVPSDCDQFISQSSTTFDQQLLASKKHLYLRLCSSPILFNNDTLSFSLNKWSGKKCFMLGARMLTIASGDNPEDWIWKPAAEVANGKFYRHFNKKMIPDESRFPEIAELKGVDRLDIKGIIPVTFLSSRTTYGVYFVFQRVHGRIWVHRYVKAYLHHVVEDFDYDADDSDDDFVNHCYLEDEHCDRYWVWPDKLKDNDKVIVDRRDGWLEVEMGKYPNYYVEEDDDTEELEMRLKETTRGACGIVVQGIELRPLD